MWKADLQGVVITFRKIALSCLCSRHLMFNGTDIKGNFIMASV